MPNATYSIVGNDENAIIEWTPIDTITPNQEQINLTIEKIKAEELKVEADKLAAKQSAQAKLAALGLTPDEITAISNA